MVQNLTFDDMERLSKDISGSTRQIIERASKREGKDVFLSHSSKDEGHLPLIVHILENHGASVYVDAKDQELPVVPSVETAQILRQNLLSCRKFIVFVTSNSKDSRWIPWELGLGDGQKRPSNVALIPASQERNAQWPLQEYLGLYDRILWGNLQGHADPVWMVYNHHNHTGTELRAWLRR